MKSSITWVIFTIVVLLTACDPLAPDSSQSIIVVTNTPTQTPEATTTALFGNPIPTRQAPTQTPTSVAIPTATVPPCNETAGSFFESDFQSAITGEAVPYNIYLPPCFFTSGRRYPYLILMHGSGFDFLQWATLGIQNILDEGIQDQSLAPMVVVMPEGGDIFEDAGYVDTQTFEDVLLDELKPHLESNFCLLNNREGRAIGGITRGAFWAFSIAFRNPSIFGAVGGHSPNLLPDNAPNAYNPLALAESAANIESLRIYVDNAQNDEGGSNTITFSNSLRNRGIVHEYAINATTDRENAYWEAHLVNYLSFYAENWVRDVAGLPSCQS